ncbi:MAG: small subunit ribosomal protein [Patescibacteria group bacterium]|jgi:small subunit ribosomal protein S4|nr:small subunit ribosomal protein [Patescibacteria group bacterium]
MSRYTGPRNKLARKIGEDLGLKSNPLKLTRRLSIRPGQHGAKGRRKVSDYGTQLQEKQKIKFIYGITETYLRKVYDKASRSTLATGELMMSLLERRLDNVVYRLGWANTRAAARQLVSHGHLMINGRKMDIPSYVVSVADVVTLNGKSVKIPHVAESLKSENAVPEWLEKKQAAAKITRLPVRKDVSEVVEEQLVIEYYSR